MFTTEQIKNLISQGSEYDFYNEKYWRKLSHAVIKEQHGECQICKSRGRYGKAIITHHVNHLKGRPDLAYERYYITPSGERKRNLIAVCRKCHEALHGREWHGFKSDRYKNDERW